MLVNRVHGRRIGKGSDVRKATIVKDQEYFMQLPLFDSDAIIAAGFKYKYLIRQKDLFL